MKTYLIVAGEPSGDVHAAGLARALKKQGGVKIIGVGGIHLKEVADEFIADLASHPIVGLWEPFWAINRLRRLLAELRTVIERVDSVIPVDYFGFNWRLARVAHELNKPVFYFVSPQVWATRRGRIQKLKSVVKRMLVIFPFEEKIYEEAEVPVSFVGHPLLDVIPQVKNDRPHVEPVVGLMPVEPLTE